MNNNGKGKHEKHDNKDVSPKKKPFNEPRIKIYSKLEDITLFTSVSNVTGTTFF